MILEEVTESRRTIEERRCTERKRMSLKSMIEKEQKEDEEKEIYIYIYIHIPQW